MNIVIFGAGQYGIRLLYELLARGIKPKYFIDNNPNKIGKKFYGVPCYPITQIEKDEKIHVVIAQKLYKEAYEQINRMSVDNVAMKIEIDKLLLRVQPNKIPIE